MSREQDVATFDSATGSADALGAFLRGEEWAAGGAMPRTVARGLLPLGRLLARAPRGWIEAGFGRSGWLEAIEEDEAGKVSAEAAARRLTQGYPEHRFPVALVGAPNGAAAHLAALLGAPWLSQTFLVLVRHGGIDVDEPQRVMEWAQRGPGRALLEANPELILHQMHDPNNDRLMARHVGYFRVKRTRLGDEYERFLAERLAPGGTLVTVECRQKWPATRAGERHWFQFGGMGALSPEEYREGSDRVADFLEWRGSHRRSWEPPPADADVPEAEWGWEDALLTDVERFAELRGFQLRRLIFDDPEDLSAAVADLYRSHYRSRGLRDDRLLVDSFSLIEPWWALRSRSVPFWLSFNSTTSAERLESYVEAHGSVAELHLLLIQHGMDSMGLAPPDRWQGIVERASEWGRVLAMDLERFPRDVSTYLAFQEALREIPSRYPIPPPVPVSEVDRFFAEAGGSYPVEWTAV